MAAAVVHHDVRTFVVKGELDNPFVRVVGRLDGFGAVDPVAGNDGLERLVVAGIVERGSGFGITVPVAVVALGGIDRLADEVIQLVKQAVEVDELDHASLTEAVDDVGLIAQRGQLHGNGVLLAIHLDRRPADTLPLKAIFDDVSRVVEIILARLAVGLVDDLDRTDRHRSCRDARLRAEGGGRQRLREGRVDGRLEIDGRLRAGGRGGLDIDGGLRRLRRALNDGGGGQNGPIAC